MVKKQAEVEDWDMEVDGVEWAEKVSVQKVFVFVTNVAIKQNIYVEQDVWI